MGLASGLGLGVLLSRPAAVDPDSLVEITLSAEIDGADQFIFTPLRAWNEHLRYERPTNVVFNGKPWVDLAQSPPGWTEFAKDLDLKRASVAARSGREVVAVEITDEGFDVYFTDSFSGKSPYEVTVKVPRR